VHMRAELVLYLCKLLLYPCLLLLWTVLAESAMHCPQALGPDESYLRGFLGLLFGVEGRAWPSFNRARQPALYCLYWLCYLPPVRCCQGGMLAHLANQSDSLSALPCTACS